MCEDAGPHEVDHLGHLVDVHRPLALQLLGQGAEGTQRARRHGAPPGQEDAQRGAETLEKSEPPNTRLLSHGCHLKVRWQAGANTTVIT